MIIADPFGSWVKGAHEGINDALALHRGQDEAAQSAYGLQRAAQGDPYHLAMLRNAATTSGINTGVQQSLYNSGDLERAERGRAQLQQMGPSLAAAQHNIYGPLFGALGQIDPNMHPGVEGLSEDIGKDPTTGEQIHYNTPFNTIYSPQLLQRTAQVAGINDRYDIAQQKIAIQKQAEALKEAQAAARAGGAGNGFYPTGSSGAFGGINTNTGTMPTPSQQPKSNADYMQQYRQPISNQRSVYGL